MFLDLDRKPQDALAVKDDSGKVLSYGELVGFANEFKSAFPKRTLIFVLAENSIDSLLGFIGALSAGIVPLVLSKKTESQLLERLKDMYRPEFVWAPNEMGGDLDYTPVFRSGTYSLFATGMTAPLMHEELSMLLPTSGSTGSPKLVRHNYRNIESNARNVAEMFHITPDVKTMAVLPMHYTMGLSVITSHLYAGAETFLSGRSLLDKKFWDTMKQERITSFTGVPFSYEILHKIRFFRMDLPDLRIITQGGGKLDENIFRECCEYAEKNGKQFIATYGQTECTARMAFLSPELASAKVGSIGKAEPNGMLSIVDENGVETFEGEATGEMVFRGENVTMGYALGKEDLLKGDENHGVRYTGDIAYRDGDGCYYIVGRKSRFLKIFGLRIGLDEVESLIKSNFDTDCVCGGDDECLEVHITNGNISDQVLEFVVEKTHLYHGSIKVVIVDEIKRNETGKAILF